MDGEFKIENRDLSLMFRGSSNQRVTDIKETCRKGSIALKYPDEKISHMASKKKAPRQYAAAEELF